MPPLTPLAFEPDLVLNCPTGPVLGALDGRLHDPMDLGVPTLLVDTTAGYDPPLEAILRFVRTGLPEI